MSLNAWSSVGLTTQKPEGDRVEILLIISSYAKKQKQIRAVSVPVFLPVSIDKVMI